MRRDNKKSICIIVDHMSKGGAEKAASQLSKSFFKANYKVSIICMQDAIDYDYKGQLYNLGKIKHRISLVKTFKKIRQLNKTYNLVNADVYIDFRYRGSFIKEFILNLYVFKIQKTILGIRSYNFKKYIPQHIYFYKLYRKAKKIVAVSNELYNKVQDIYDFSNVTYIPNYFYDDIYLKSQNEGIEVGKPFLLAIGRLKNEVKQFDKLILAYKNSKPANSKVPLVILGKGEDKKELEEVIEQNKLQDTVKLLGFKNNPYPYIKACKFVLLSSKYEGFPMVLVESLGLGTPVIAFNCKSGPSEIIENNLNGILVEDQDFNAFTEAINKLYSDDKLYSRCKANSKASIERFSEEEVFKKWESIVNS